MTAPRILLQLDADPHPSSFDAIVALDAGAERLLSYGGVRAADVSKLVHGAIFTRGGGRLAQTAIFIGGSQVSQGEELLAAVQAAFVGPLRVSVLMDTGGANTTAAAAVLCAARHLDLRQTHAVVLGSTGPLGQRVTRMLLQSGAHVVATSRELERARVLARSVIPSLPESAGTRLEAIAIGDSSGQSLYDLRADLVIAAGAAGVELACLNDWPANRGPALALDLNAVPPAGIRGILPADQARQREGILCYGPIGVGQWKMQLHRELIRRLFTRTDLCFDAREILDVGRELFATELHRT